MRSAPAALLLALALAVPSLGASGGLPPAAPPRALPDPGFDVALARAGPGTAEGVPAWAAALLRARFAATPEPLAPDAATQELLAVADPDWQAWLLRLDGARRTAGAFHAATAGEVPPEAATASWHHLLTEVGAALAAMPPGPPPSLDVCGVVRVDGAGTSGVVPCDYLLLVDFGGDDTYLGNAGGSAGPLGSARDVDPSPPGLAVELAGRDTYACARPAGGCAGGGHGGAGALFEMGGADVYANRVDTGGATGGGGRWGLGFLLDAGGDDRYGGEVVAGGLHGGSGFGGAGLLIDQAGDDAYDGWVNLFGGISGGSNDGLGVLVDLDGRDARDGRVDQRGGVNGGGEQAASILYDGGGDDDAYDGHVWGGGVNGAGTDYGILSLLVDDGGADTYAGTIVHHGGVNGFSNYQHPTALLDLGDGDDTYAVTVLGFGGGNGAAAGGQGLLLDEGGSDHYTGWVRGSGALNGAAHFGQGVLLDLGAGDDTYAGTVLDDPGYFGLWGPGHAINGQATVGLGLLLDGGGSDTFDPPRGPAPSGLLGLVVEL